MADASDMFASYGSMTTKQAQQYAYPAATRPEARMKTTSSYLSTSNRTNSSPYSVARYAGEVRLPALSITAGNIEQITSSSAIYANDLFQPRRNGRDDGDDPADPPGLDTPIADAPVGLILLLCGIWIIRRAKNLSGKLQKK